MATPERGVGPETNVVKRPLPSFAPVPSIIVLVSMLLCTRSSPLFCSSSSSSFSFSSVKSNDVSREIGSRLIFIRVSIRGLFMIRGLLTLIRSFPE